MSALDRAQDEVESLLKRRLKINPGLEAVERHKAYGQTRELLAQSMKSQVSELLRSDLFKDIDTALGPVVVKADRVGTESDDIEVQDAVLANIKKTQDDVARAFSDFLILVFNMGGQDFLNKHNIPATFELTNPEVIDSVKATGKLVLSGVDDTTASWVADQIIQGRADGLSNADIASNIRDAVPDTYDGRAERIVRTETSRMVGHSENLTATNNGASHKEWVTVSDGGVCSICQGNEDAGTIGLDSAFPSGDQQEPAHPNCRCLVEYHFTPFMGSIWAGN
jgi:hypothetical protein